MPQVRYLGFSVGEGSFDSDRSDGDARFFLFAEPMPVGTVVEIDGLRQRVTRVEEGQQAGFWLLPEGASLRAPAPVPVEPETTVPSAPSAEMAAEPEGPEDGAPEPVADATEAAAPEPTTDEPSGGGRGKRKRRPKKTVLGR